MIFGLRLHVAVIFGAAVTVACTTVQRQWIPSGGSRADGIVRMVLEVGELETVNWDEAQTTSVAATRCRGWGYKSAEAFGLQTKACAIPGVFSGCKVYHFTREFQCVS